MRIVQQSVEEVILHSSTLDKLRVVERIGRTCYKSENLISYTSDETSKAFCQMLCDRGHLAMLEHVRFTFLVRGEARKHFKKGVPFVTVTKEKGKSLLVSASPRAMYENLAHFPIVAHLLETSYASLFPTSTAKEIEALINSKSMLGKWYDFEHLIFTGDVSLPDEHTFLSVKFTCDRAIANELVRHRVFSWAQESTRYCNYTKDKFQGLSFIEPPDLTDNQRESWKACVRDLSDTYVRMIESGMKPEMARSILPCSLKAEIWMTGSVTQFRKFVETRHTSHSHPQMFSLVSEFIHKCKELNINL